MKPRWKLVSEIPVYLCMSTCLFTLRRTLVSVVFLLKRSLILIDR
jgi:hypothetical protein